MTIQTNDRELTFDEAEAAGFDGTGRDGDPRFPYHLSDVRCAECGRPMDLGESTSVDGSAGTWTHYECDR